jgi:hypothetical protein
MVHLVRVKRLIALVFRSQKWKTLGLVSTRRVAPIFHLKPTMAMVQNVIMNYPHALIIVLKIVQNVILLVATNCLVVTLIPKLQNVKRQKEEIMRHVRIILSVSQIIVREIFVRQGVQKTMSASMINFVITGQMYAEKKNQLMQTVMTIESAKIIVAKWTCRMATVLLTAAG